MRYDMRSFRAYSCGLDGESRDRRFTISRIEADPRFVRMLHNAPPELWVRRDSELGVPRSLNRGMASEPIKSAYRLVRGRFKANKYGGQEPFAALTVPPF
jgi:hypothetical protein